MGKMPPMLGALLCSALLAGCGGDSGTKPSPDTNLPSLNQLTVAIRNANDQQPIANAEVIVTSETQKNYRRTTDAQGKAQFQLESGHYQIASDPTGFQAGQLNVTLADSDQSVNLDLEKEPIVGGSELYLFHSDYEDSHYMQFWGDTWGSGASVENITNDATFSRALKISSGTNWGFGAAIAWGNEQANAIDARAYNYAQFYLKPSGFTQVEVVVNGFSIPEQKITYPMSDGGAVGNGWLKFEVPIPSVADLRWFGLVFLSDQNSSVMLSNLSFIHKEVQLSEPTGPAPVPNVTDSQAFSIFSDSLQEDKFVSLWNENWWNAPIYSSGVIKGNHYSRYEIAGAGSNGGVVGIQYGIEYGSVDVSKHDVWNIDLYAESGIERISLQLVSTDGSASYEINNPVTNQWVSYAIPMSSMLANDPNALNTKQMQMAGIQMWGAAGKALFVDNFYFSGSAEQHQLAVTVKNELGQPLQNATVFVGQDGEYDTAYKQSTNASGVASLQLSKGKQKVKATAEGYGVAQWLTTLDNSLQTTISLEPLKLGPTTPAPVPNVDSKAVISLFSDALTSDSWISYWSDNWWNAPKHELVNILGNQTAKFTPTPDGVSGGVTGIQYGIERPVDASNKSGMHLDLYLTSGINKVQFQLLSSGGPLIYTLDSLETGKWLSVELPFTAADGNNASFDQSKMQQLGMALWGSTSDSVYLDNIYFY